MNLLPTTLPTLEGRRITLRAMKGSDSAALRDIYGDPLVMKYTGETPFRDLDTVRLMLESVRRLLAGGESLEWAIALQDSDQIIGTCGLHSFDPRLKSAEVGCLLTHSAWGHGYMTEAITRVMSYAEEVLGLEHLTADVAPENERAQHLFQKLGYRQDRQGILKMQLTSTAK
jgi:ribosomal-protein-alanine N-acetyltransferase